MPETMLRVGGYQGGTTLLQMERMNDGIASGLYARGGFTNPKKIRAAASILRVDPSQVVEAAAAFRASGLLKTIDYRVVVAPPVEATSDAPVPRDPVIYAMRNQDAPASTAIQYRTLLDAVTQPGTTDDLISWGAENRDLCCAVDVDWHGEPSKYTDAHYAEFVQSVTPAPRIAWMTRSRGLRLIYEGKDSHLRAAVAAVRAAERFAIGTSGIELKTESRHPGTAQVWYANHDTDLAGVLPRASDDFGDVDEEAWQEWLRESELSYGRFSHDRCLINPGHRSNSATPVEVRPNGVMCHSCGGATGRGWLSASHLMRDEDGFTKASPLYGIVANLTHWEQSSMILRDNVPLVITDDIMRTYYEALLVAWHGSEDERIASVFRERDLLRFNGFWGSFQGEKYDASKIPSTLKNLPACRDETGEVKIETFEKFNSPGHDLKKYGYTAVRPVFGCRIGTKFPGFATDTVVPRLVVPSKVARFQPEYLQASRRMSCDVAWQHLAAVYPGINTRLVELLIFCRGLVERGCTSMHPKFIFDGVSGSGKTSHSHIAAAICGDRCTDITAETDDERLGQKVFEAMRVGSFATIDEVVKSAKKARVDARTLLTFILNLTPDTSVHALYIGQVRFEWLPVLCITDTDFPEDVLTDEQLGRRLVYCHLGTERLKWEASTRSAGLRHWADPRSADFDIRVACDSILSDVTDRFFKDEPPDLAEAVRIFGFKFLNECDGAERHTHNLRDFFAAWKALVTDARYPCDSGWKAFETTATGDIQKYWGRLHDPSNPCSWQSRNSQSWKDATGHPLPLRIDVEEYKRDSRGVVKIRFDEKVGDSWMPLAAMKGGA